MTYKTLTTLHSNNIPFDIKTNQELLLSSNNQDNHKNQEDQHLNIGILKQWIIFITFLFLEPFSFAIAELIPFGLPFLLIVKISIIYPNFLVRQHF